MIGQKARLDIEILNDVSKCIDDYSCLNNKTDCLCEVIENISDKVLFVKAPEGKQCSYMLAYGFSHICTCPARKEIYRVFRK